MAYNSRPLTTVHRSEFPLPGSGSGFGSEVRGSGFVFVVRGFRVRRGPIGSRRTERRRQSLRRSWRKRGTARRRGCYELSV